MALWVIGSGYEEAFASDFSAPLQNVQASLIGSTVSYQVFDPGRSLFVTGSANTPASYISNPSTNGGVVAWVAGNTVYYRIYDPGRSNWVASSRSTAGFITEPTSDNGLVAWLAGSAVYFAVYDPVKGAWEEGAISNAGATSISTPKNSGGVIAWSADQTVWYVSWDPMVRGVAGWKFGSYFAGTYITDIQVGTGVAAWLAGNTAYYILYDVSRTSWRGGIGTGGFTTSLGIANSTVSWLAGTPGISYIAGYNSATGAWTIGAPTPAHAAFLVTPASGNAPLFVWFTDLSLGGSSWAWNFGDGGTANARVPYHVFSGLGRYTVLETVFGPTPTSTAGTNILTDTSLPAGSLAINGDDPYTRSTNVTLTLSVTDNSGVISAMRFSNTNNLNWSPWVPYATSFPWVLSTGDDGFRSVYGQFMDPASNISFTISDTISLYTQPNPIVSISNYFVPESTPSLQIDVTLSSTTVFPVLVDFATSDGTATAGSDYAGASAHLRFNPGQTHVSLNLFLTNDTFVELNETINLVLSNPTNATLGPPSTVTILDDDPPFVSFATNMFTVDELTSQAIITAILGTPSGRTLSVDYASSNGTATAGIDYSAVSGTIVFAPGQVSRSFVVPILPDADDEFGETVLFTLSNPTNALLGARSTTTLIILDDDPPPASFATNQFVVNEAAGSATISVRLNTPFSQTVFVGYTTSDGTAMAGGDYVAASGTLIFAPGETNKTFFITIFPDSNAEANETIHLTLTSFNNATPGLYTTATLTIFDDGPPRLSAYSWRTNTGFQSTLSGPPGRNYAIEMSSNLVQWSEIVRVTNTTGTVPFSDAAAGAAKTRFYRARQTN